MPQEKQDIIRHTIGQFNANMRDIHAESRRLRSEGLSKLEAKIRNLEEEGAVRNLNWLIRDLQDLVERGFDPKELIEALKNEGIYDIDMSQIELL